MRITKTAILLSSLSILLLLSACKQAKNEQTETQEPVVSVAVPESKETAAQTNEMTIPQEEILVSDDDTDEKTVKITGQDFGCIREMQPVRDMYVANILGNIDATQAVANSEEGGIYPPGTVIQLVPGEAMVKREQGFNAATNDWEFFVLKTSSEGTEIVSRGGEDVKNDFGQNCLSCHAQAEPKWDMVCETDHGCAPLPITRDMIVAVQKTDERCEPMELSDVDKKALADLQKLIETFKAQQNAAADTPATSEAAASEPVEEITETEKTAPDAEGEENKE
ncbi:hypothetical protein [Candidatus Electrothrix sp.]|uniref:hypothetical protein n=1 Tax=Candidatus Electrothrix sp. TaxID=2170559 RepID=UPI004055C706